MSMVVVLGDAGTSGGRVEMEWAVALSAEVAGGWLVGGGRAMAKHGWCTGYSGVMVGCRWHFSGHRVESRWLVSKVAQKLSFLIFLNFS